MDTYKSHYRAFNYWFEQPQGFRIAKAFNDVIKTCDQPLRGQTLLQLGTFGDNLWLPSFTHPQKIITSPLLHLSQPCDFYTGFNHLAIDRLSADLVIAPFLMESCLCDFSPFDEIDRVLKDMGLLLIWGFNPLSLWGLALKKGWLVGLGGKDFHLMSYLTVIQEMKRRGYRQYFFETFYHAPPVKSVKMIHGFEFLNQMGKMMAIVPAGFYCVLLQKYTLDPSLLWLSERYDAFAI